MVEQRKPRMNYNDRDERAHNTPSQKRRKRKTLLLNELNEAENEVKSHTKNGVMLKAIGVKSTVNGVIT